MRICKAIGIAALLSLVVGAATAQTQTAAAPAAAPPAQKAPAAAGKPAAPSGSADETRKVPAAAEPGQRASAPAAPASMDGATYVVRLRDLEQRVDELKEQIRRSHTRLSLLSDTILSGGVGGARADIRFKNDLSSAFRLIRLLVVLDGAVQYNKQDDTGALAAQGEIPIFSGSIPSGDHTLQVLVELRGHGYGVFSYLRGYTFSFKSQHSFTVTDGKAIALEATLYEHGGVTTPLEQRPKVAYKHKLSSSTPQPGSTASPAGGAASGQGKVDAGASVGTGGK
jgi:hypothetical protein